MPSIRAFSEPIYVTRPVLPDLDRFMVKLREIWDAKWLTNNGQQHALLEQRLVESLKVPYLSLFNNGTIALITACQSLRQETSPRTPEAEHQQQFQNASDSIMLRYLADSKFRKPN